MAIVLRGRNTGASARLRQASNDWVSADVETDKGRKPAILNPTSIGFDSDADRAVVENAGGRFWSYYEWTSGARTRLRRKDPARA